MNGRKMISTTEIAKMIRKHLKEVFPDHKFSVRCHRYAGGSSIDVHYTDGPDKESVERVTGIFEGSTFDGMEDMMKFNRNFLNGEEVDFEVDFVHVHRSFSDETREWMKQEQVAFEDRHKMNFYTGRKGMPTNSVRVEYAERAMA